MPTFSKPVRLLPACPQSRGEADVGWERPCTKKSREEIQKLFPPHRGNGGELQRKHHLTGPLTGSKRKEKRNGSESSLVQVYYV